MEKQQEHAHAHKHFRPFPNLAWSSLAGNSHFPERSHPSSDILPHPWFIGHKSQKKRETRTAQFREGAVEKDEERVINTETPYGRLWKQQWRETRGHVTCSHLKFKVRISNNCRTKLIWLICKNVFSLQPPVDPTLHHRGSVSKTWIKWRLSVMSDRLKQLEYCSPAIIVFPVLRNGYGAPPGNSKCQKRLFDRTLLSHHKGSSYHR